MEELIPIFYSPFGVVIAVGLALLAVGLAIALCLAVQRGDLRALGQDWISLSSTPPPRERGKRRKDERQK